MKRALTLTAVLAGLLWDPSITRSCGPDFPDAVFVSYGEPDPPIEEFASGNLGVLHPSFRQKYLVVAFRRMRGLPLDTHQAMLALGAAPADSQPTNWAERWRTARNAVEGASQAGMIFTDGSMQIGNDYIFYTGCLDDGFRTAIATLDDRTRRAASHPELVLDWIHAQDQVFANCRGDAKQPDPAPPGAPQWLVQDRAYQSAAAFFYANRFDEARAAFEAIGREADSPWSVIAPYMVARTLTRQGTLTAGWQAVDTEKLEQAQTVVASVLADPRRRDYHAAARRLQGFLRFRLQRPERLAELSAAVAAPRIDSGFAGDVNDLTLMLDHFTVAQIESLAATNPAYEAADWVSSFQTGRLDHTIARWRATRDPVWLAAAISWVSEGNAGAEDLIRAAGEVKPSSPAYATVSYHRARLLQESRHADQARELLDRLLAGDARSWPRSAQNLLHARRLRLARTPGEFLAHAQRLPAAMSNMVDGVWAPADSERARTMLDDDGAWLLNQHVPIQTLASLLKRPEVSDSLRARLALAGWTRAILLKRDDLGVRLAETAAAGFPALRDGLLAYAHASTQREREIGTTWLLLHAPGAHPWIRPGLGRRGSPETIDVYHDNWWCRASLDPAAQPPNARYARDQIQAELYRKGWDRTAAEALVEPRLRAQAERERAAIDSLGPAPDLLCRRALAWADQAPADPRVPEALAIAVKSTRYGCADKTTTAWSKRAFQRLHRGYPKSEWTRKTPYWY